MGAQVGVDAIVDWGLQVFGKPVFEAVGMMNKQKLFKLQINVI